MAEKIKTDSKIFWKYVRSKSKTQSTIGRVEKKEGGGAVQPLRMKKQQTCSITVLPPFSHKSQKALYQNSLSNQKPPLLDNIEITEDLS